MLAQPHKRKIPLLAEPCFRASSPTQDLYGISPTGCYTVNRYLRNRLRALRLAGPVEARQLPYPNTHESTHREERERGHARVPAGWQELEARDLDGLNNSWRQEYEQLLF